MRYRVSLILLLAGLLPSFAAMAQESLDSVLARAAAQKQAAIDYHEVRHLQLLSEPWHAEGTMYVTPSVFVIEQLAPQRQLICADRSRLWLLIPERHIRRSMMLTTPVAKKNISLIRPIMHGDREALEKQFDIRFSTVDGIWRIELLPKEGGESPYSRITVSGSEGAPAERMKTELADGDYSEWTFKECPFDEQTHERVEALIKEAKGI